MSNEPDFLVSTMDVPALLECLNHHGVCEDIVRGKSGIDFSALRNSEFAVSLRGLLALWKMAEETTGNGAIGIHLRDQYGGHIVHFVNYIALNSKTFGEALQHYERYGKLFCKAYSYDLKKEGETFSFSFNINSPSHQNRWIPEFHLSSFINFSRASDTGPLDLQEVCFQHSCPTTVEEYESFFRAPVRFGALQNAIIARKRFLDEPMPGNNPHLQIILKKQAEAALENLSVASSLTRSVENVIMENIGSGRLDIEMAANALKMHRSTLHRKLKENDTSFNLLLLDVRKKLSIFYLKQGLTIDRIACLLGYANRSGFQYAFKSWFGETPAGYRQTL